MGEALGGELQVNGSLREDEPHRSQGDNEYTGTFQNGDAHENENGYEPLEQYNDATDRNPPLLDRDDHASSTSTATSRDANQEDADGVSSSKYEALPPTLSTGEGIMIGNVNGAEIHFSGANGFSTWEGAQHGNIVEDRDSDEEEEEARRRVMDEEAAMAAEEADFRRRTAPLEPEKKMAIIGAMKGITLGGYVPDWAKAVPEEEWIEKLRSTNTSKEEEGTRQSPK
eukprot:jgi/Mesen1/6360/ME000328S05642